MTHYSRDGVEKSKNLNNYPGKRLALRTGTNTSRAPWRGAARIPRMPGRDQPSASQFGPALGRARVDV